MTILQRNRVLAVGTAGLLVWAMTACTDHQPGPGLVDTPNPDTIQVRLKTAVELGALTMPPALAGRDGTQSVALGNQLYWQFGDSFFTKLATDGMQYRTNTAARSTLDNPLVTTESVDANGVSDQFIPFTADEKRFNDSTHSPIDRIALWPTGVVSTNNKDALVFFTKVHLRPQSAGPWQDYGIGLAHFVPGQAVSRNPGLLFTFPDPNFQTPFIHDNYLYVWGYLRNKAGAGIGRAPINRAESRSDYEFWNGSSWAKDVGAAAVILNYAPNSVSYNPYFKTFIDVYNEFGNETAYIRFANRPEGPWSPKQVLYVTPKNLKQPNYLMTEQPALAKNRGKTITISYSHALPGFLAGDLRLVELTFK